MRTLWLLTPLTLVLACGPADPSELDALDEAASPVASPSPSPLPSPAPTVPRRLACNSFGSIHLRPDGRVSVNGSWPGSSFDSGPRGVLVRGVLDVVAVAAARTEVLLLTQSGVVYRAGPARAPTRVSGLPIAASIHGTDEAAVVLGRDGSVWVTGWFPVAPNDGTWRTTPAQLTGVPPFVEISVSSRGALLGRDVNGAVWLVDYMGATSWASTWPPRGPHTKAGLPSVRALHATDARAYVVTTDGRLMSWGSDRAGDPDAVPRVESPLLPGQRVVSSPRGLTYVFVTGSALDQSGAFGGVVNGVADAGSCWASVLLEGTDGRLTVYGQHPALGTVSGAVLSPVDGAAAGDSHSFFLREGVVRAAGLNDRGQLGVGAAVTRSLTPTPLSLCWGLPVTNVASGADHGLAVCASGEVWSWGANEWGQLGQGTATWSEAPRPIPGVARAIDVRAGFGQSFVILADRTVLAFGRNVDGQLGLGLPLLWVATPLLVPGVRGVADVAVGDQHTLWLTHAGRVWAAGSGARGQLGVAGLASTRSAQLLPTPTQVVAIAAMAHTNLAVATSGSSRVAWVWGADAARVFGSSAVIATPTQYATPFVVPYAADGGPRNLALLADGQHHLFGGCERNQIQCSWPITPPIAARYVFGDAHSIALREYELIVAGANESGQLGLGNDVDSPGATLGL